jgi:hypothetical protein
MSDNSVFQDEPNSETNEELVKGQEGVDWFWVLTSKITIFRDKMLILDIDETTVAPVFKSRKEALDFLARLDPQEKHMAQAMHVLDIKQFAQTELLGIVTLDGDGRILEVWSLK